MLKSLNTPLSRLRLVAILEGCSFLSFAITMPLKYKLSMPLPNYIVGMAHGILFITYIILVIQVSILHKWSWIKTGLALLASIIPFGTFYADAKIFKKEIAQKRTN